MKFELVRGVGDYEKGNACVISAAVAYYRTLKGEDIGEATDELECCCPVIRKFLIKINDNPIIWKSNRQRTEYLLPLIPLLVGSRSEDCRVTRRRLYAIVNWCIREVCPLVPGLEELAKLNKIVDSKTCIAARKAAADAVADAGARRKTADTYAADNFAATYAIATYAVETATYSVDVMYNTHIFYHSAVSVVACVASAIVTEVDLPKMIQEFVKRLVMEDSNNDRSL